jgi:hypothetical protein
MIFLEYLDLLDKELNTESKCQSYCKIVSNKIEQLGVNDNLQTVERVK